MRADRLKLRREQLGLTQEETAKLLGVPHQMYYRYEKGVTKPSSDVLAKIAPKLDVTADWLLGLVEEQTTNITESDLSPTERLLIDAVRRGATIEAIETAMKLGKRNHESGV